MYQARTFHNCFFFENINHGDMCGCAGIRNCYEVASFSCDVHLIQTSVDITSGNKYSYAYLDPE